MLAIFATSIAFSMAFQAVGAFCDPSTWDFAPTDTDLHHERFWDRRDTEVSRGLKEWRERRAPPWLSEP